MATAVVVALVAGAVCGALGWWQWTRAQAQATVVAPAPEVPLSEVMLPGERATGIGRRVVVEGAWGSQPRLLVTGRNVEGQDATLLVVPLTVDGAHTAGGEEATLAVLAGWLPAHDVAPDAARAGEVTVRGYLRGTDAMDVLTVDAEGSLTSPALSTAALAGAWDGPVYSVVLTAAEPAPGWNALPVPEPERHIDVRSATYTVEWWLFGAFAVVIAVRWIRDNGRRPLEPRSVDLKPVDPSAASTRPTG